jgi:hypothetical protein
LLYFVQLTVTRKLSGVFVRFRAPLQLVVSCSGYCNSRTFFPQKKCRPLPREIFLRSFYDSSSSFSLSKTYNKISRELIFLYKIFEFFVPGILLLHSAILVLTYTLLLGLCSQQSSHLSPLIHVAAVFRYRGP